MTMTIRHAIAAIATAIAIGTASMVMACSDYDRARLAEAERIFADTWAMANKHLPTGHRAGHTADGGDICMPELGQVLLDAAEIVLEANDASGCLTIDAAMLYEDAWSDAYMIRNCLD